MPPRTVGRIQTRAAFGQLQRSRARASCGPVRATFVPADPECSKVYIPRWDTQLGSTVAMPWSAIRCAAACASPPGPSPPPCPGARTLRVEPAAARCEPAEFVTDRRSEALQRAPELGAGTHHERRRSGAEPGRPGRRPQVLRAYQAAASGRISPCRFYPSCSQLRHRGLHRARVLARARP